MLGNPATSNTAYLASASRASPRLALAESSRLAVYSCPALPTHCTQVPTAISSLVIIKHPVLYRCATMTNEQINVPSLVVILVLSGLIVRYLFFSAPATPARPPNSASAQRALEPAVERIQQMFPLVDRRTILWDLQRNGGNMTQTTERILAGQMETVSRHSALEASAVFRLAVHSLMAMML